MSPPDPGPRRSLLARLLHLWFRLTRGMTLGVRAIVRTPDGKVLLLRHTYVSGWHFPGGGIEPGETAIDALRRELREEAGLTLVGTPRLLGVFHNRWITRRDHVLAYLCEATGEPTNRHASLEIAEVGFFAPDALPPGVEPGTLRRIGELTLGTTPPEVW